MRLLLVALLVLALRQLFLPGQSTPVPPRLRGLTIVAPEPPPPKDDVVAAELPGDVPHSEAAPRRHSESPPPPPKRLTSPLETPIPQIHRACTESPAEAIARARERVPIPDAWRERRAKAFAQYMQLHRAFVKAGGSASHADVPGRGKLPRKFIIVKPCCQLCNRVRVLISALALGMLTDRAVLIEFDGMGHDGDYYGRFDDLFDAPVHVQARLPRHVEARLHAAVSDNPLGGGGAGNPSSSRSDGGVDGDGGSTAAAGSTAASVGPTVGLSLPWLTMMSEFMCSDAHWNEPAVTIQGSPGFLHAVYLSPSLRPAFDEAFGGLDGLFAAIFHSLLRPRREIVNQARAFIGGLLLHAAGGAPPPTHVVGLHIRNGRDFRTKKLLSDEWGRLAGCAAALVPSGDSEPPTDARRRARFAVATESGESRTAAAAALGDSAAFYMESLPKGKDGGTTSREGAKRALLELLIVAFSNATLLTPMSSFSETVAALNGRPGLYFHFDTSRKFHFESATEALPGCFVPWTAEMPGSMNLHSVIAKLPKACAARIRKLDAAGPWTNPCGLRFLSGSAKLPEKLSRRGVTAY